MDTNPIPTIISELLEDNIIPLGTPYHKKDHKVKTLGWSASQKEVIYGLIDMSSIAVDFEQITRII